MSAASKRRWFLGSVVALTTLEPMQAGAQAATALDRFEPAPAGEPLRVASPAVNGDLAVAAGLVASFAHAPLVLYTPQGDSLGEVISYQLIFHNLASIELGSFLKADVDIPFTVYQDGPSPSFSGPNGGLPARVVSPEGPVFNDLRAGVRLEVLEQHEARPSVGLGMSVWFPTGDAAAYSSGGGLRYAPALYVGADYTSFLWTTKLGAQGDSERDASTLRNQEVEVSAALGPRLGPVTLSVGLDADFPIGRRVEAFSLETTHLEIFGSAGLALGPLDLGVCAGTGLTTSPGTPDFRGVLSVQYAMRSANPVASPRNSAGTTLEQQVVPDTFTGPKPSPVNAKRGVQSDRDCAAQECDVDPAKPSVEDPGNGVVRIVGEQIVITQKILFATGKSELLAASDTVLAPIVELLNAHSEIARLSIEGHTDSRGSEQSNIELSRARAFAVMRWMIDHGVDERRLEASGFGPRRPIADNATDRGREENRRVDFQILKRTTKGPAGWQGGASDEEGR